MDYYADQTMFPLAANPNWTTLEFGFLATSMIISNDSPNTIYISFMYPSWIQFTLFAGETISFDNRKRTGIYLSGQAGGEAYRVTAWANVFE